MKTNDHAPDVDGLSVKYGIVPAVNAARLRYGAQRARQ